MGIKITVENGDQNVTIEDKTVEGDMPAEDIADMFFRAMIGLGYSVDMARKMFSDEVNA